MKTINKFLNNFRNTTYGISMVIAVTLCFMVACSPDEDNDHKLGGSQAQIPQDIKMAAADNENEVVITFDPLTFIDGDNILGVQFSCEEAGINFVVKDITTTTLTKKVYRSGEYTLYVAAITRAGTGTPREIPFTVVKNLLLETLSESVLPEVVKYAIDATHDETFYKNELYIEQNSLITLAGALASDDVIVNLDFFSRESTTSVKFLGESGVYSIYWNPVRKNVIIEPTTAIESPKYYVFTGLGIGYPTTVSSEDIKAAYGAGDGRYTTEWDPGKSIRSRVILRSTGTDTYQGTICINEGAAFKPFSNANWGNDVFAAQNCTFTGSQIFNASGDWSPNDKMDKNGYYQITVNASTKVVIIKKVSATGEELEDNSTEEPEPSGPIVSDNFDLTNAKVETINGELFLTILQTLEKDAEYTLKDALADADIVYNLDFFKRVSTNTVKFLGESGDYSLCYSVTRKIFFVKVDSPDFPDYLVAVGKGFAYPSKASPFYVSGYPQNCASTDILNYVLYRHISGNTYQATVMLKGGTDNLEFKGYHAAGGGFITSNWGNGGEYKYSECTFSGTSGIFAGAADGNNWVAGASLNETSLYRVTLTITEEKKSANVKVEVVNWNGEVQP